MFKGYQDTSNQQQFKSFPNLFRVPLISAYGFSGVTFWLDAAFGLNTQTNLNAVTRWEARVGGSIFEQSTAGNQPRLILSDANYNNLPSVEAQDSSRFMDTLAGTGLKFIGGSTTVAVISKVNTAGASNTIISEQPENRPYSIFDGGTNTGLNGFGLFERTAAFMQGTTESTNPRIKIITRTNIIVNGVSETTSDINYSEGEFTRLFRLSTNNLVGSLAEIIAFDFSMTSAQAIQLSNNINSKYAIY